jgi:hypothetical protein
MTILERMLVAFDVPAALVGDLLEESHRGRSRVWLCAQAVVAVGHAIAAAVRLDALTAARTIAVGAGLFGIGAQLSLWLYVWATFHVPFPAQWQFRLWFVLAWHSYSVPLHVLWCATSLASGRLMNRVDRQRRLSFVVIGIAAQLPVLIWFAWPAVQALVRVTHPPTLLRYRIAFAVDLVVVMIVMPALTLAAALKGCATGLTSDSRQR